MAKTTKDGEEPKMYHTLLGGFGEYFYNLFNIRKGLDWIGTVTSIRNKIPLQGENIWMLVSATMIASVGLNLNSGAVIIGAMLISPLMSPILGIGLGIGINDRDMLAKAVKSFTVATLFAIVISFLYFKYLTPFKDAGSEIISRTTPTVLDALVAIFGGVAGIVAVSRKDKGAAIPGVAIATALLPPLAVSGYGLSIGSWEYFTHAFYLFFLNSMLIALSTYLVVRFLGFPLKEHQTKEAKRKARIVISTFVVALLIPGALILRKLIVERETKVAISNFFDEKFDNGENQLFGQVTTDSNIDSDTIVYNISYRGTELDIETLNNYQAELSKIHGDGTVSIIDPTLLNLTKEQLSKLDNKKNQMDLEMQEVSKKEALFQQEIENLQNQVDSLSISTKQFKSFENEIPALWPEIESFSFGSNLKKSNASNSTTKENLIALTWVEQTSEKERENKKAQLKRYLAAKFNDEQLLIVDVN